jgi:hypothetical protein
MQVPREEPPIAHEYCALSIRQGVEWRGSHHIRNAGRGLSSACDHGWARMYGYGLEESRQGYG